MPRSTKICILIQQHLANAPRVQKEAKALSAAGYDVTTFGSWWNACLAEEDQEIAADDGFNFVPLLDLRSPDWHARFARLRGRASRHIYQTCGMILPDLYGLAASKMVAALCKLRPALTMAHCEAGMWAACRLLREGYKVGVDFEDWFSEDLLPEARKHRPVAQLARMEKHLLHHGSVRFATTAAMASALHKWSGCETAPVVIPNCFAWSEAPEPGVCPDQRDQRAVSFYWFSQKIGPGRGLETLAEALPHLIGNWQLHLRGRLDGNELWVDSLFGARVRSRVFIHAPVSNEDLAKHGASHDVGLALEVPYCPSRDLTATNKIFDYLRCGLAVIATDTSGQREVMSVCSEAGWLIDAGNGGRLAAVMQCCIDNVDLVAQAKRFARQAAMNHWAWERYEPIVLKAVNEALTGGE